MSRRKRTAWITDALPYYLGVYERDYSSLPHVQPSIQYANWNGVAFMACLPDAEQAATVDKPLHQSPRQDLPWRGLVSKPRNKK